MNSNLRFVRRPALAAVFLANLSLSTASAEPLECMCPNQGLVVGTVAPRTIGPKGTFVELATALGEKATTEEEAVSALCPASTRNTCNAGMQAFATVHAAGGEGALNIHVRTGKDSSGPWVVFDAVAPAAPDDMSTSITGPNYLPPGRRHHAPGRRPFRAGQRTGGQVPQHRRGAGQPSTARFMRVVRSIAHE